MFLTHQQHQKTDFLWHTLEIPVLSWEDCQSFWDASPDYTVNSQSTWTIVWGSVSKGGKGRGRNLLPTAHTNSTGDLDVLAQGGNPSIWKVDTGGLWILDQTPLQRKNLSQTNKATKKWKALRIYTWQATFNKYCYYYHHFVLYWLNVIVYQWKLYW